MGTVRPAAPAADSDTTVPRLVKFSGTVKDSAGKPRSGITGITFALYKDQASGAALWLETQNVSLDAQGRYTVLLGANSAEGTPRELFSTNEAQWLGVQPEGLPEQRVLLVSVPYALKAADAETLGGMPASSFVLAAPMANAGSGSSDRTRQRRLSRSRQLDKRPYPGNLHLRFLCSKHAAPGGTANFLPLFTDPTTVQNSVLSQNPCPFDAQTCLGLATPVPLAFWTLTAKSAWKAETSSWSETRLIRRSRRNWAWGTETFNVGDVSLFVSTSNVGFAQH